MSGVAAIGALARKSIAIDRLCLWSLIIMKPSLNKIIDESMDIPVYEKLFKNIK